jgi:hypothetical protein
LKLGGRVAPDRMRRAIAQDSEARVRSNAFEARALAGARDVVGRDNFRTIEQDRRSGSNV